jgi:hypothetical protein
VAVGVPIASIPCQTLLLLHSIFSAQFYVMGSPVESEEAVVANLPERAGAMGNNGFSRRASS